MDESGISVVQKRCQKIIGLKGKHQIGVVSSAERGINTTVVCCFNAAGMYVLPIIIFKRKRLPPELKDGAPCGSMVTCNETGWMSSGHFPPVASTFYCLGKALFKQTDLVGVGWTQHACEKPESHTFSKKCKCDHVVVATTYNPQVPAT